MRLIGLPILDDFKSKHTDVASQIDSWIQESKEANWKTPHDIKRRYSSADFFKNNHVVINLKGNKYRLLFAVNYPFKVVVVKNIGTHSEYNQWKLS